MTTAATFSFPTTIRFGAGAVDELPSLLSEFGIARPLVVTDGGLCETEAFRTLQRLLPPPPRVFAEVRPNPVEADVAGAARAFLEGQCDGVIAFGGGSALDVGKAVRLTVRETGATLRDFDPAMRIDRLHPCIAIPTTAGTGSEVGRSSVIIVDQRKRVFFHPALLADLVLLDPTMTAGLPPKLTAATGADALTHCIESFTSPVFHPFCDGIALEGIRLIAEALPRAVRNGTDMDARGKMQVAAAMGGIAFQKDLGATHSLAHPLSSICALHHGLANALCLPHVMRFNAARKPGLYERVGIALGGAPSHDNAVIDRIRALLDEIGIRGNLRDHGVQPGQLDALVGQAWEDSCHRTNPVPVTPEDLRVLYEEAL
jgi:alcohol dehydrogenase class IV